MDTTKMDTSFLREVNTKLIMNCLRTHDSLSRIELYEKTNLSKPTVTRVTSDLISNGFIKETDIKEISRGRHRTNIEISAEACYCFGINISRHHIRIALIDLKLKIIDKVYHSIREIESSAELLELIASFVENLQKNHKIPSEKIIGIGIGAPGLIDCTNGIIKNFALLGKLKEIPIADYLEKRTSYKVKVDNNCNTTLAGEIWSGYAQNYKNALLILNGEGVGGAIARNQDTDNGVNDNESVNLGHISSGFGHISVNFNGDICTCGNKGCVETYCTILNIERKANDKIAMLKKSNFDCKFGDHITYKDIFNSIEQGELIFSDIIYEAATALASGIVNVINIFYPEIIILSGSLFDISDYYYNTVLLEINRRLAFGVKAPKIIKRKETDSFFEIGAASLILKELF